MPYKGTREEQLARRREYYIRTRERRLECDKKYRSAPGFLEKHNERQRQYTKTAKRQEYRRAYRASKKYGITLEEYDALMQKPCAICGKPSEHVDHCHETGKVRAGLCARCNRSIGAFGDDPALLLAASEYLSGHRETNDRLK